MKSLYISLAGYIAAGIFGLGLYLIITEFVISPSSKARKSINFMLKEKVSFIDQFSLPLANFIVKYIKLDKIRRRMLKMKLTSAEIKSTPEMYVAKAISNGIVIGVFAVPMLYIMPVVSVCCAAGGVLVYFASMQEADVIIKKRRESIETDLVLFSSTITQSLATTRDVLKIFRSFRNICGSEFRRELDITIADMKTGNYEEALKHLDERVNSSDLSEIIRGLLAVMRGDNQQVYFEMLTKDLMVKEKENLKREAAKRPDKMHGVSVFMISCFLAMFLYAILSQVVSSFKLFM